MTIVKLETIVKDEVSETICEEGGQGGNFTKSGYFEDDSSPKKKHEEKENATVTEMLISLFSTVTLPKPELTKPRKKYARSKPPKAPSGPCPMDKEERKKFLNRIAAFRYRDKMKSAIDSMEDEMEKLEERNRVLRKQLTEMETKLKYLKKLMTEAGLVRMTEL